MYIKNVELKKMGYRMHEKGEIKIKYINMEVMTREMHGILRKYIKERKCMTKHVELKKMGYRT